MEKSRISEEEGEREDGAEKRREARGKPEIWIQNLASSVTWLGRGDSTELLLAEFEFWIREASEFRALRLPLSLLCVVRLLNSCLLPSWRDCGAWRRSPAYAFRARNRNATSVGKTRLRDAPRGFYSSRYFSPVLSGEHPLQLSEPCHFPLARKRLISP